MIFLRSDLLGPHTGFFVTAGCCQSYKQILYFLNWLLGRPARKAAANERYTAYRYWYYIKDDKPTIGRSFLPNI